MIRQLFIAAALVLAGNSCWAGIIWQAGGTVNQAGHLLDGATISQTQELATGSTWNATPNSNTSWRASTPFTSAVITVSGATGAGAVWNGTYTPSTGGSIFGVPAQFWHRVNHQFGYNSLHGGGNWIPWEKVGETNRSFRWTTNHFGSLAFDDDGEVIEIADFDDHWTDITGITFSSYQNSAGSDFGNIGFGSWDNLGFTVTNATAAVPEPGSFAVLAIGAFALGCYRRRRGVSAG